MRLAGDLEEFPQPLRTPVEVFGNLIRATRGESVLGEVLGSGDASVPFQSFTLAKKPLTHLAASTPRGFRSTLEVRVDGILWKEERSFFGQGPEDQVYIVREDDEGASVVTFGDGVRGARLPTGVDNVVASYRFGAGAAKPPAGTITQLARPVKGLRRVVNPVAAFGGKDPESRDEIRETAPESALTLGRAVSPQDFEVFALDYDGLLNVKVEWTWDESSQTAALKVWFIADRPVDPEFKNKLRRHLEVQGEPDTPIVVEEADAFETSLVIDPELDPDAEPGPVLEAVREALTNQDTGLFALTNVPIGQSLFRSQIFDQVVEVDRVISVRAISWGPNRSPFPVALSFARGRYLDVADDLIIGATS